MPLLLNSALLPHLKDAEDLWERRLLFSAALQTPGKRRQLAIPLQQQQSKMKNRRSLTKKIKLSEYYCSKTASSEVVS